MLSATSESLKVQRGTQTVMALISDKGCAAKRLIQGVDAMPICVCDESQRREVSYEYG